MDWNRVESARQRGRSLLVLAGVLIAAIAFGPGASQDPVRNRVDAGISISDIALAIGLAGMLFGLAWMWRIHRAPSRYEKPRWRYRDR